MKPTKSFMFSFPTHPIKSFHVKDRLKEVQPVRPASFVRFFAGENQGFTKGYFSYPKVGLDKPVKTGQIRTEGNQNEVRRMIDIFEAEREKKVSDRKWVAAINKIIKGAFNSVYAFRQVSLQQLFVPAEGTKKNEMIGFLGLKPHKQGEAEGATKEISNNYPSGLGVKYYTDRARKYLLKFAENIDRGFILRQQMPTGNKINNPPAGEPTRALLDEIYNAAAPDPREEKKNENNELEDEDPEAPTLADGKDTGYNSDLTWFERRAAPSDLPEREVIHGLRLALTSKPELPKDILEILEGIESRAKEEKDLNARYENFKRNWRMILDPFKKLLVDQRQVVWSQIRNGQYEYWVKDEKKGDREIKKADLRQQEKNNVSEI